MPGSLRSSHVRIGDMEYAVPYGLRQVWTIRHCVELSALLMAAIVSHQRGVYQTVATDRQTYCLHVMSYMAFRLCGWFHDAPFIVHQRVIRKDTAFFDDKKFSCALIQRRERR